MQNIHLSNARGHANFGWLDSFHSFSFGSWQDPRYMGFSALRVINDDRIAARSGFGKHPHDNMEILTYVISGTISHADTMGNAGDISAGQWQLMSAGTGLQHSEVNQTDQSVHLLQIWLFPDRKDVTPRYQQHTLNPKDHPNRWHLVVGAEDSPEGAPLTLYQNAYIRAAWLEVDHKLVLQAKLPKSYLHVIAGSIVVAGQTLGTGDAIPFETLPENCIIKANHDSHLLWFELP